jgi:hypothetical protein
LARRKQKQKNKQKNKFKTDTRYVYETVKSTDIDKIAYQVFGALTYSSEKTF